MALDLTALLLTVLALGLGLALGRLLRKEPVDDGTKESLFKAEMEKMIADAGRANREEFFRQAETRFSVSEKENEKHLATKKAEIEGVVNPLKEMLEKMTVANQEMEKDRVGAYQGIRRHLEDLAAQTKALDSQTTALSTALTTSGQARGNWGEVKLRRLFEIAGLTENVDFFEQETIEGGGRPDFIVRLPDEGVLPIDAKAIGGNYLAALEMEDGPARDAEFAKHATAVRNQIKALSSKAYADAVEGQFDQVIMFIPSESMASAAFQLDPDLMEYALTKKVLVTTPMTMMSLLRTIALYWQQHALAEGTKEIHEVTKEMYRRTVPMMEHVQKVGGHISKAAGAYNDSMSSYEKRVLPQARRLDELKVSENLPKQLPDPGEEI